MNRIAPPLVILAIFAAGCDVGSRSTPAFGNVSFENKPVEKGTIEFIPIENTPGPSLGSAIKNGKYEIARAKGPLKGGVYQVRITNMRKTGKKMANIMAPGGPPLELEDNFIPAKYNTKSILKVTVTSETESKGFDFTL